MLSFKPAINSNDLHFNNRYHEEDRLIESSPKYDFWFKRGLSMLNVNEVNSEDAGKIRTQNRRHIVRGVKILTPKQQKLPPIIVQFMFKHIII